MLHVRLESEQMKSNVILWGGLLLAGVAVGACVRDAKSTILGIGSLSAVAAAPYDASKEPIVAAVKLAAPSVVSIDTTSRQVYQVFDDPMDRFWGNGGRRETREVPTGAGSGVLLKDGYVLTNQHVVGQAVDTNGSITVRLPDGRSYKASAVGTDRSTDVALLKVETKDTLPVSSLGLDGSLVPGQAVIAIGNPVGLSASVSSGVVSALGRPIAVEDRLYENLIQTDTAINPGNSGGALVDLGGRVVGINTLVRNDAQNIGFSIPIQTAMRVADSLRKFGKVRRPTAGIIAVNLDDRLRRALGVGSEATGVVVWNLYRGMGAIDAGLQRGDLITEFAGQKVTDELSFRRILEAQKIGTKVKCMVRRGNEQGVVDVQLSEAP